MTEETDLADLVRAHHDNIILIDGLPDDEIVAGSSEYIDLCRNLEEAAMRICETRVTVQVEQDIRHDRYGNETRYMMGFAFIAFPDRQSAANFRKYWAQDTGSALNTQYNNPKSGRSITVYPWRQFYDFSVMDEDDIQFDPKQFRKQRNLWWYLEPQKVTRTTELGDEEEKIDKQFNDQYVIRYAEETNIFWNDELRGGRTLVNDGSQHTKKRLTWTRDQARWSKLGGYLVTFHPAGINLWGGPKFDRINRFEHRDVDYIDFSPDDQFIVTCNTGGHRKRLQLWEIQPDVPKGQEKNVRIDRPDFYRIREWQVDEIGPLFHQLSNMGSKIWPIIKWTSDSQFFAFADSTKKNSTKINAIDKISVFERLIDEDGTYFNKLGKKSIPVSNVFDYEFSPTHNILSYTTCIRGKKAQGGGASLVLTALPSKSELKTQQLGFDVIQPHLYWHPSGRFLAVRLIRVVQKVWTSEVGVLVLDEQPDQQQQFPFQFSDRLPQIETFNWAPTTAMYAVMSKIPKQKGVVDIRVYSVDSNGTSRPECSWSSRRANDFLWSPDSTRAVIANVGSRASGDLEFIDFEDPYFTVKTRHEGITQVAWDPSGRYICTCVTTQVQNASSLGGGSDTGYRIWSFQGDALYEFRQPLFYSFSWRPRPKFELDEKETDDLHDRWEDYFHEFEEYDDEVRGEEMSDYMRRNRATRKKWEELQRDWEQRSREIQMDRRDIRGYDTDGEDHEYETTYVDEQVTVDYTEIEIPPDDLRRIIAGEEVDFDALAYMQSNPAESVRPTSSVRPSSIRPR